MLSNTLNVNGLTIFINRQRLLGWIFKKTQLYDEYKKYILHIMTQIGLKMKGKSKHHANTSHRKVGMLVLDNVYYRLDNVYFR